MKKIGILTSGGDSPGMNAAIRAAVRCGLNAGLEVYGIFRGFEGLIEGELKPLDRRFVGDVLQRGGTKLKTARCPRFTTEEGQARAVSMLETFGIEGLIVIGGDGSLRGGLDLSKKGIKVMGIPGTIDNDLGYTDYTIGFDTAVNTVLDAITKIRDTSSSHDRTTVIEVMGRNCGDIALYSGLAGGAEVVLIPEVPSDITKICKKVIEGENRGKEHSIIIRAEGDEITSDEIVEQLALRTGKDTRLVVLSYLQRGGSPSLKDRTLATLCGAKAIELLTEDSSSKAIGIVNDEIRAFDLEEALAIKRTFNREIYDLIDELSR